MCGNCKGKGHEAAACASEGGGKHTPKGKGKGQPNFYGKGSGAWAKGGKVFGKGKGKGKISDVDEAGWIHVGANAGGDWNWASGSEWAAAEAVPGCPLQPLGRRRWRQPHPHGCWQPSQRGRRARPLGLLPEEEPQPHRRVCVA